MNETATKVERLLSVTEVMARTGLAERTIRRLIAQGQLPIRRPAGLRAVRVPEQAIVKLIEHK
jgi:excisionase family DNA binding protein